MLVRIEPGERGGKPTIRGLRITVQDVLEYMAEVNPILAIVRLPAWLSSLEVL